ncbi:MAG: c-type cytochrome [Methylococcales bacterium]|nr:c-type cytochrome [Methylococcales bacterium]
MQKITLKQTGLALLFAALSVPTLAMADDACVALGALVYTNFTSLEAGGTGLKPVGETSDDMYRCKSCHGWDRLGKNGGHGDFKRVAKTPNTETLGEIRQEISSNNISTGTLGKHAPITAQMILHAGTGRSIADGSNSWVDLTTPRTAANTAAYLRGYSLGNQHPDYTGLMTAQQLTCLGEFLNSPDTQPDKVFKRILTGATPIAYQLVDSADAKAGKSFYAENCESCHGAPDDDQSKTSALKPVGGMLVYLKSLDQKFSEFAHKSRWGLADTKMTRKSMSNPTAQDMANVLKYIQDYGHINPLDNCGKSIASVAQDAKLHIPRVSVPSANGDIDYWATLRYAPELSPSGKMVFELADISANTGTCK